MGGSFQPLPVESVAKALAAFPIIKSTNGSIVDVIRNALARHRKTGKVF